MNIQMNENDKLIIGFTTLCSCTYHWTQVCVCVSSIHTIYINIHTPNLYIYIDIDSHDLHISNTTILMTHFYYCQPPQAAVAQPSIRARCTISPEPWRSRSTDAWEWINAWLQFFGMEVMQLYTYKIIYICMYHHISKYISYHIGCCMVGCNLNHLGMVSTI